MCFGRLKNSGEYVIVRGVCRLRSYIKNQRPVINRALVRSWLLRVCRRRKDEVATSANFDLHVDSEIAPPRNQMRGIMDHPNSECKCRYFHCHGPILNMRFSSTTEIAIFFCPSNSFRFRCSLRNLINHYFPDAICFLIKSIGISSRTVIKCFFSVEPDSLVLRIMGARIALFASSATQRLIQFGKSFQLNRIISD